jgi:hypothetical protein
MNNMLSAELETLVAEYKTFKAAVSTKPLEEADWDELFDFERRIANLGGSYLIGTTYGE